MSEFERGRFTGQKIIGKDYPETPEDPLEEINKNKNKDLPLNDFEIFQKTYAERHADDVEIGEDLFCQWAKLKLSEEEYNDFLHYDIMDRVTIQEQENALTYAANPDDIELHKEIIDFTTNSLNSRRENIKAYITESQKTAA